MPGSSTTIGTTTSGPGTTTVLTHTNDLSWEEMTTRSPSTAMKGQLAKAASTKVKIPYPSTSIKKAQTKTGHC